MGKVSNSKDLGVGKFAEVYEFTARGSITALKTVRFDSANQTNEERVLSVIVGDATAATFGVALDTVTTGQLVRVCTSGYIEGCTGDTDIAQDDPLVAGAAGAFDEQAAAGSSVALPILGVALEEDTASVMDIYLFGHYR